MQVDQTKAAAPVNGGEAPVPETQVKPKEKEKKFKEPKGYQTKLKSHDTTVLYLYSKGGINGNIMYSGSADHTIRCK